MSVNGINSSSADIGHQDMQQLINNNSHSFEQLNHNLLSSTMKKSISNDSLNNIMNHNNNSSSNCSNNNNGVDTEKSKQVEAEKKRKRLERNRESARECRKRKKEKKNLLRQQLAHLEADNLQLRLKLQVGHDNASSSSSSSSAITGSNDIDKSAYITAKLDNLIKNNASDIEIQKTIGELQEKFSDYGRDRRSAIDFHVNQLKRCLQPTQTTRAILYLMSLAPQYHDSDTGRSINQSINHHNHNHTYHHYHHTYYHNNILIITI